MKEIFLSLNVEQFSGGGYLVTCEDLPGLVAQGNTEAEAIETAQELARKLVQSYMDNESTIPPILNEDGEDDTFWSQRQPN
jgi:predicted RNase H-like HicB family nuclease